MLKLAKAESQESFSHEEVFIQQYDSLIVHAFRLTDHDREAAEDLVLEAFVQFTFSRPEPHSIKNLEGYLYGMLRNLRLMDLRRAANRTAPLALIDYDSVDIGLRARDVSQALQTKNELALICSYACQRKRTSKAGSVLILRFFHGYYPNEIAQVIQSSRPVVSELLQVSRSEARRYLEDPRSLTFLGSSQAPVEVEFEPGLSYSHLLRQLRKAIFKSRVGVCLSLMEIEEIYGVDKPAPVDVDILQHLVSCESCLDSVNRGLKLPLLAERNPADMLSPEKRDKSGGPGSGGPDDPGDGGSHLEEARRKCQRRARRVFEHVPRELRVSVNGDRQFSQTVASETCEQTISLEGSDAIEFVELSSEQGVRLLFMQVFETSEPEQSTQVDLSDGRVLRLSLDRTTARPRLHVRYENPVFTPAESQVERYVERSEATVEESLATRLRRALNVFSRPLRTPYGVIVLSALLLIAGLFWFKNRPVVAPVPVLSADNLLTRSVETDQAFLSRTDTVLHREIKFQRKVLSSNAVTIRNVEVWHSAEKGITARRLFDEKNRLIAGLWQTSNGVQRLYQHGKNAELKLAPQPGSALNLNGLWSEEPTAATFLRFVGSNARLQTEELASTYLISYQPGSPTNGILRALVVLAKADLHVTELTVVVDEARVQGRTSSAPELVEYQFVESSFEKHSPSTVTPSVFEPDPILRDETGPAVKRGPTDAVNLAGSADSSGPGPRAIATREVEVEVLRLLHEVKADQGEQVSVTRTRDGFLRVEGVVDTDARKEEILNALRPITSTRAVWVEVETVAEAWERQRRLHPEVGSSVVQSQSVNQLTMPAEVDLHRYFASQGDNADELTRQYAMRMITRSRKSMVHVYAMKRVLAQFSVEELARLNADAKTKWLGLVSAHATAYHNELNVIQRELQPVFFAGQTLSQAELGRREDLTSAIATAQELVVVATENDAVIRYSFTTSNELSAQDSSIKGLEFWRALERAARLASRLANTR